MLGWFIIVRRSGSESGHVTVDPSVLATWKTSIGGLAWLDELEQAGKATCLSFHGYPTRYTTTAEMVLPMLQTGMPPPHVGASIIGDDYVTPAGGSGPMTVHDERIAQCSKEEQLFIDAWDQS